MAASLNAAHTFLFFLPPSPLLPPVLAAAVFAFRAGNLMEVTSLAAAEVRISFSCRNMEIMFDVLPTGVIWASRAHSLAASGSLLNIIFFFTLEEVQEMLWKCRLQFIKTLFNCWKEKIIIIWVVNLQCMCVFLLGFFHLIAVSFNHICRTLQRIVKHG